MPTMIRRLRWGRWLLVAQVVAGCRTTTNAHAPGVSPPLHVPVEALTRSQYEVLGRASGEACAEAYALWPLPIFWIQYDGQRGRARGQTQPFALRTEAAAARSASYKAMLSQDEADVLLYPRARAVSERKAIWYRKSCVRVEGKAIRIRLDEELSTEDLHQRPSTVDAIVR